MHLDDESRVAVSGSKTSITGKKRRMIMRRQFSEFHSNSKRQKMNADGMNDKIVLLRKENEQLRQSVVTNENVEAMNAFELIKYERKLKQQLKDLAREITKVYKQKTLRRV